MNYKKFDHRKLLSCIKDITTRYSFVKCETIGKSNMEREIFLIKIGKGDRKILTIGAHHSLEWITSAVLTNFVYDYADAISREEEFQGDLAKEMYKRATYYIIPMLNPDGVDIVLNKIKKKHPFYKQVTSIIPSSKVSTYWQANIRGVDLNHNYDAAFSLGKRKAESVGISSPNYTRYPGKKPFSEPETEAVRMLCERENFHVSAAFHTQGEVIYDEFNGVCPDKELSQRLLSCSGYERDSADGIAACSGFKDWMIDKMNTPSFTVELGYGKNPLPFSQFEKIKKPCYNILKELSL